MMPDLEQRRDRAPGHSVERLVKRRMVMSHRSSVTSFASATLTQRHEQFRHA